MLTSALMYSVRFGEKLPLPRSVQDNIARLRITPVSYKPFRPPPKHVSFKHQKQAPVDTLPENWRANLIANYVSKIRDSSDPEYHELMAILNKVTHSTVPVLVPEAVTLLRKRDHEFRLRVSTLIFNKAITQSMFASVMGDFAQGLVTEIPEIKDDLNAQVQLFPKLYDTTETLVYPKADEEGFEEKLVAWNKQKDKRRGYAKFLVQLFTRNLVSTEEVQKSLVQVLDELDLVCRQPKSDRNEENTNQFVDFMFEVAKVVPSTAESIRTVLRDKASSLLSLPRPELPSLCMRSRFKLEDALKCVQ